MVSFFFQSCRGKYYGIPNIKEKIMEFIERKLEYLIAPHWAFMTALILSGWDFTNLKQYSLSNGS